MPDGFFIGPILRWIGQNIRWVILSKILNQNVEYREYASIKNGNVDTKNFFANTTVGLIVVFITIIIIAGGVYG